LKKENNDDQKEQVALYAKKGRRPKCNHCGKIGHMSKDCWELEKNKDKKAEYLKKHGMNNKDGKNHNQKEIKCYNFGKAGHIERYCRQPKRNNENKSHKNNHQDGKALNVTDEEFVLMSFGSKMETKRNDWILDLGASNHMTNSLDGFKEMQTVHQKVMVGNGKKIAVVQSRM